MPDVKLDVTHVMCVGMTGSISVKGQESARYVMSKEADPDLWPPRFWKVQLNFSKGVHMAFCDPRRQAQGSGCMSEVTCTLMWSGGPQGAAPFRFEIACEVAGRLPLALLFSPWHGRSRVFDAIASILQPAQQLICRAQPKDM